MAYTRAWLQTQIKGYLKDRSVDAELDNWIDLGAKRISKVLECWEMEGLISNKLAFNIESGADGGNAASSNLIVIDGGDAFSGDDAAAPTEFIRLPNDFIRLLSVQALTNDEWRNLRAIPRHEAYAYRVVGVPSSYVVEETRIYPLPFTDGSYRALFLQEQAVPTELDAEIPVLTRYPFIYLNAALAEAYDWKQDEEMSARYEQKWINEAQTVRGLYRGEHVGEVPAVRAI